MLKRKIDLLFAFLIFIISGFLVLDIFINQGEPATFDGRTHITTIAQFHNAQKEGEARVTWADNFANYGMPIPLISQQTTAYLGSVLTFLTEDVVQSYNYVYFLGALLSALFYYIFLRIYFNPLTAFTGTFLFNFAPYRIINLYIRGAQPEFFASVFTPLILISIYLISIKKNDYGILLLVFSTALLILTHPFMFIVSSTLFIPYTAFCIYNKTHKIQNIAKILFSLGLGIGISAFYTLPLFWEIKYFHYGINFNHFVPEQFMKLQNFFDPSWYYFYKEDVFIRGNFIKVGLLETLITISGVVLSIYLISKKHKEKILYFSCFVSILLIFFITKYSDFLYQNIKLLNGIQHPWRMLYSLNFVTPIILCAILVKLKHKQIISIFFIICIAFIRFPQLYGKNYTIFPQSHYYFTKENLHGNVLNTLWTGKTSEYPIKKVKPEIISGSGKIKQYYIRNSSRAYKIYAYNEIRMVDNTFYFPGWWVYIDGEKTPIEYQDPNFRGIITYSVPPGIHNVEIRFENTKPRILGYVITIFSLIIVLLFLIIIKTKPFFLAFPKASHK